MSSGRQHERINKGFLFVVITLSFLLSLFIHYGTEGAILAGCFMFGYGAGTYYLSPDLDVRSRPYKRWGPFRFIWIPYQTMFTHRSFWTHGILLGDLIRFLYLLLWLFPLWGMLGFPLPTSYKREILVFFSGTSLASVVHILTDHSSSFLKKRKKRRK
ncbi:metal-binding protein (plasmid) [Pontibacillus sp. ALD_SL1]|uniref:metal-binding protein n=1 Tax=Pontibacillus sp. ALD_SL1 TaxID=2777185 RepID=UPI001A95B6BE|nr:metal-binding protein [Pontibacillus sp. ALD_SL1]